MSLNSGWDKEKAYQIVCSGKAAGGYAAFPDICRCKNGDLLCVFYSGYGHVSKPNEQFPNGGRIMAVRSMDNGKTWSLPFIVADTVHDDRDPHIACLRDGTLICNWFVTANPDKPLPTKRPHAVFLSRSTDNGKTWSEPTELKIDSPDWFACSAPVRELPDGSLILGLYHEDPKANRVFGATVKSYNKGRTWTDLALIGEKSGLYLDAETDVISLKDGTLVAALRSSKTDLYFATSTDNGKTWSEVRSSGFKGHCPHFLRHSSGAILLSHRIPATALHWSFDEGKTWDGPLQIDTVGGAYPSCVELADGTVYCVYYEEGKGSSIRGVRLRVTRRGVEVMRDSQDSQVPHVFEELVCRASSKVPRYSAPCLFAFPDGRILLAYDKYDQGKGDDHDPCHIAGRFSKDGGRTWSRELVLHPNDAKMNVMQPSFVALPKGEVLFFFLRKNSTADLKVYVKRSRDGGRTWTGEVCVTPYDGYHQLNNDRVIRLRCGRLLVPIASCPDVAKQPHFVSYVCYSDDDGRTWRKAEGEVDLPAEGADEPGVVELRDGSVMMFIRSGLGDVYKAISHDKGLSWSKPEPMGVMSPSAPCLIKRIPKTGDLLLLWNRSRNARVPLSAALSKDEGKSWQLTRDIECDPRYWYAYPTVIFLEKRALIAYWVRRQSSIDPKTGWGLISVKVVGMDIGWFYEQE